MSAAPRLILSQASASLEVSTGPQVAMAGKEKSLEMFYQAETEGCGRRVDPFRFKALFPDQWRAFLRAHFRSPEEVAVFFGQSGRTAENWWNGINAGSGSAVALAAVRHPEAFRKHFGEAA